ncbi:MAG: hypothetical protein HZB12_02320 [Candidatus Yonathbacteria bacterium]|nr:hypothetical protein [Candidatus Yonathbacteria bacterium]
MDLKTFISGDATHTGIISSLVQPAIELMVAAAVFFFLWNVFKLITKASQDEERAKFKSQVMWGVVAIAVMVLVWGLVGLLLNSTGLDTGATINIRTGP